MRLWRVWCGTNCIDFPVLELWQNNGVVSLVSSLFHWFLRLCLDVGKENPWFAFSFVRISCSGSFIFFFWEKPSLVMAITRYVQDFIEMANEREMEKKERERERVNFPWKMEKKEREIHPEEAWQRKENLLSGGASLFWERQRCSVFFCCESEIYFSKWV